MYVRDRVLREQKIIEQERNKSLKCKREGLGELKNIDYVRIILLGKGQEVFK